jgi:hypothetical protein
LFLPEPKISQQFCEFFTANIRNRNTRRAYYKADNTNAYQANWKAAPEDLLRDNQGDFDFFDLSN